MDHSVAFPFLRETLLFLAFTGVLIPLLQRARVSQVMAFLLLGAFVGPYGVGSLVDRWPVLGWVTFPAHGGAHTLAELGVLFLMFLIGLELSPQRVWAMRRWVFGVGTAQVGLSAMAIGVAAWAFGNPPSVALVLGLVLSLSSTAVVMQILTGERRLASPLGQASFAVLMLQDFAVVPLLVLVDVLAKGQRDALWLELTGKVALSVVAVVAILAGGRWLVPRLMRALAGQRQPEVFVALTLLVALSIGGLTAAAGLSMALGAFLAGLLMAETEFKHEVALTIEPFKGLLMGLFFMTVGMGINVHELLRDPLWVVLSVLGLVCIKALVVTALFKGAGLSWGRAVEGGLLLGQGGEFAFIVVGTALTAGLLSEHVGQFMLLVVSTSLLLTPLLAHVGGRAGRWLDRGRAARGPMAHEPSQAVPDGLSGHVVIMGFGRVGRLLGEVFARQRVPYMGVDQDIDQVTACRAQGLAVVWGNGSRIDLLDKLHLDDAACLVLTMDDPEAARRVVRAVRERWPQLPIWARSHDEEHATSLREAGASGAVPETLEAGLTLAGLALNSLGLPDGDVHAALSVERERRGDHTLGR